MHRSQIDFEHFTLWDLNIRLLLTHAQCELGTACML
jgi:hypothetical protein